MAVLQVETVITNCIITFCISVGHASRNGPQSDSTLKTLALQLAAHMVRLFYVSIDKQVGGAAAAGAVEAGPAVLAVLSGIDIQVGEGLGDLHVEGALIEVAQLVVLVAHKLVAGVDIPFRRDGHVLAAGAAAAQPLDDAGADVYKRQPPGSPGPRGRRCNAR